MFFQFAVIIYDDFGNFSRIYVCVYIYTYIYINIYIYTHTEDEMVGWHHQLNVHGFGWTPGVGDG